MSKIINRVRHDVSLLTDDDVHLFNEGTHYRLYNKLGSHPIEEGGRKGVYFAVWAPNARSVHVMGDFNGWGKDSHPLQLRGESGVWEGFIPDLGRGDHYKYHIRSRRGGFKVDKADPYGIHHETPPKTGSIVWDLDYEWNDDEWMRDRYKRNDLNAPISVYEVHLGSWRRRADDNFRYLSYREIAPELAAHCRKMNYTHVELMPVMEHPFFGSWGYQVTGYFAPTSRYGTPQDFMYLIDVLHQNGIGVILDWVPSHFPTDEHGLAYFDGTHLYEHKDPRQGFHPDWSSYIFNYGRNEVQNFLISSALYWLDRYHADGLRVDAVASMLHLDFSRKPGEWVPNKYGGRENLEAIEFLRTFNTEVFGEFPDVQTFAEDSTSWPQVSRPTYVGGLGFGFKWDMGWMNDTLRYFSLDPIHRKFHHGDLTFRAVYGFNENFILPLSHDEVVYGKRSMIGKMPGDWWQKFANLRLLYAYMTATPGKKMLFMGGELAQWEEWAHDSSLRWDLQHEPWHAALMRTVSDLNALYRDESALHEGDVTPQGFEWVDANDSLNSILSFLRLSLAEKPEEILCVFNCTPLLRHAYRIGVSQSGFWKEIFNSDAEHYAGSGQGNLGGVYTDGIEFHGRRDSVALTLPPFGAVFLKHKG